MSHALRILEELNEQDNRVQSIYEDIIDACGIRNAPPVILADLDSAHETHGMAGCYTIAHQIVLNREWVGLATDAELAGCLAHELAHSVAGIQFKHGPRHQETEDEIIERIRLNGIPVKRAPTQGGVIRADDWKGWLSLLAWVIPAAFAFPAFLIALAYWNHYK
jgi:hypothetical protein